MNYMAASSRLAYSGCFRFLPFIYPMSTICASPRAAKSLRYTYWAIGFNSYPIAEPYAPSMC